MSVPAKMKRVDYCVPEGFHAYAITLNPPEPWGEDLELVVDWHRRCEAALFIIEQCGDGSDHYHSFVHVRTQQTGGVTRILERLLSKHNLSWRKHVTIKVLKADAGWFQYCMKECLVGQEPFHLHGWEFSWIRQVVKQRVKESCGDKDLEERSLTNANAARVVMAYAKATNAPLLRRMDLAVVIGQMMSEKYLFPKVDIPRLWVHIAARTGNVGVAQDWVMQQLFNLTD